MRKEAAPSGRDEGKLLRRRKDAHNEEDNFDKHGNKKRIRDWRKSEKEPFPKVL